MRRTRLFLLTLGLVAMAAAPAVADNLGRPMTFQYYPARPNQYPQLQADGDITAETPALLRRVLAQHGVGPSTPLPQRPEIFLTSGGGDLPAGMEIGRIIRQNQLSTKVGAHDPISTTSRQVLRQYGISVDEAPQFSSGFSWMLDALAGYHPSYCVSACTVAFLGGVTRSIVKNSAFAVHQYSVDCIDPQNRTACSSNQAFLSAAQRMSAQLATYLEAMGVSEAFLTQMVLAEPKQVNVLSDADLSKYRIVYIPSTSQWDVKGSSLGGLTLIFDNEVAGYKTHLEFACAPRRGSTELTVLIVGDHYYDRNVALSARNIEFSYYPDNTTLAPRSFSLASDEILRYPYPVPDVAVGLMIRGTPRIVDALRRAGVFSIVGHVLSEMNVAIYANVIVDRDKLGGYITSCR